MSWRDRNQWSTPRWTLFGAVVGGVLWAIMGAVGHWYFTGPGMTVHDSGYLSYFIGLLLGFPVNLVLSSSWTSFVLNGVLIGSTVGALRGLAGKDLR